MKKDNFQTIKIPNDINDLSDYKYYIKAAKHVNNLKSKLDDFAWKLINTHFLFTGKKLEEMVSEDDLKLVLEYKRDYFEDIRYFGNKKDELSYKQEIWNNQKIFFDSKNKRFWLFETDSRTTSMGSIQSGSSKFEFSENGKELAFYKSWSTKEARFEWVPWIKHTEKCLFDLVNLKIIYIWKDV